MPAGPSLLWPVELELAGMQASSNSPVPAGPRASPCPTPSSTPGAWPPAPLLAPTRGWRDYCCLRPRAACVAAATLAAADAARGRRHCSRPRAACAAAAARVRRRCCLRPTPVLHMAGGQGGARQSFVAARCHAPHRAPPPRPGAGAGERFTVHDWR